MALPKSEYKRDNKVNILFNIVRYNFTRDKIFKLKEIRQNIHESIHELVVQMQKLNLSYDSPNNHKSGEWILELGKQCPQRFYDVSEM